MPNDSIQIIHDTVFTKGENAYDLVSKVDAMYTNAWDKLMLFGGVIASLATIVVPWWLNRIRSKQEMADRRIYEGAQQERVLELKKHLDKEFDEKISNELAKYKKEVERHISGAKAAHFYLLAESHLNKKDYQYAFVHFIGALRYALFAEDLGNVKAILLATTKNCIPSLSLPEILACEKVYNLGIDELLSEIAVSDKDRLLFDVINEFKIAISQTKKEKI